MKRMISLLVALTMVCTACGSESKAVEVTPAVSGTAVMEVPRNVEPDMHETKGPAVNTEPRITDDGCIETVKTTVDKPADTTEKEIEVANETILPNKTSCNEVVYTNTTSNIRLNPSTSGTKVATVNKDTELLRTGVLDNGWSEVQYNGNTCYISSKLVTTAAPTVTPVAESVQVTSDEEVKASEPTKPVANNTDGQTKTFSDGSVFVARGTSPGGLTMWYCDWDTDTWPDWFVAHYDACGVTNEMSDYDKAVTINNYLCRVLEYEEVASGNEDKVYTANCLQYGKANCTGYARAFISLCTIAGVGADYCGGTATNGQGITGGHAWNFVLIGDTKYYVDVCWNDGTNNSYLMSTTPFSDHQLD